MTTRIGGPAEGPNIVPIPDPAHLLDPLYLEAHSLVDQVPRDSLELLLDWLRVLATDGPHPTHPGSPPSEATVKEVPTTQPAEPESV